MENKGAAEKADRQVPRQASAQEQSFHGRICPPTDQDKYLDTLQLLQLELSFRDWIKATPRNDIALSRRRILLIFLLIRHTGAKLSEALGVDPFTDIDFERHIIGLGRIEKKSQHFQRKVPLPESLCREIKTMTDDITFKTALGKKAPMDPGFVRHKFYERAEACKIPKQLGGPEILRKSRAVELMQNNMPLPAVQMILGHSTPNLTSSYVSFSEDEILQVTRLILDKESLRKTSARNTFFGKIQTIRRGSIQTQVELLTMGGLRVTTVITNDSVQRLGLNVGRLITAEVKAPWVMLQKGDAEGECSADNRFSGTIQKIVSGKINSEYMVQISDGTQICSILTTESSLRLDLTVGDTVGIFFNSASVVLFT